MDAASGIAAQIAQTRTNVAYSAIKSNAQAEQALANVLQSAISNVPNSPVKGTNVDLSA